MYFFKIHFLKKNNINQTTMKKKKIGQDNIIAFIENENTFLPVVLTV